MSDMLGGKLDNSEIKEKILEFKYSSGFEPSNQLIESILEQCWFHDVYNSFISDQVYLNYLLSYLNTNKPKGFNHYDFYKYIFDQVVTNTERSTLQQIALAFEKLQSNAMPPEEYNSLLHSIGATDNLFSIQWMEKSHLGGLKKRDDKEYFIWEHHTLTEFLVAENLLQQKTPIKEFEKLAVLKRQGVTAFKPSWSGVLRFLIESSNSKKALFWFIAFLKEHTDNLDDNLAELLVYKASNEPNGIKDQIFNLIYANYFDRIAWTPVWARVRLSQYVNEQSYKRLKKDIKKWSNKTETFVRRGNAISVIEGLLKDKNKLLNEKERQFWKEKLICFANQPDDDGNGVLQRHSLGALAQFKDKTIIPQVAQKCFEETTESLVRNEFIEFCIETDPNSHEAIDYFVKGTPSIYARHGLYLIKTQKAIEYFLGKISQDEQFLRVFLDKEHIFDKEEGDRKLLKSIETHANAKVILLLKKLIFTVLRISNYYDEGRSSFLRSIVQIVNKNDPSYLFEVLSDIKSEQDEQKIDRLFWDSRDLLAYLLTKDNVKKYFDFLQDFPDRTKRDAPSVVYSAKRLNGNEGNLVYEEAVKLKLVEKVDKTHSQKYFENQEKHRKEKIYKSFLRQLEPKPGKYLTSVFEYFLQNKEEIMRQWKQEDRDKLFHLAVVIGIRQINPRDFKVTLANKNEGNSSFTWSSTASYYGDLLDVVKELAPDEIEKHRQNIIDFIPYEFDTGATLGFIKQLNDKELEWVNTVMGDKEDDRRYLIPQTYIYLVGEYTKRGCRLTQVKPVLKSFISDPSIRDYTQRSALEALAQFVDKSDKDTKQLLKDICQNSQDKELVEIANGLLITIYTDDKAIDWRLEKIKEPLEFERVEGAHSVGKVEEELMSMSVAKPLMDLGHERYLPKFLDLLDYSFKFTSKFTRRKDSKKYWEYVNYLWKTVAEFVDRLKTKGSFIPLMELENWVEEHTAYEHINWFQTRIKEIKRSYLNLIYPFDRLVDGVDELGKINSPMAKIALFLFKAQLVETRLRDLMLGINYFLQKKNSGLPIYRKLNSKTKQLLKNSTLSTLCKELSNYQSPSVKRLQGELSQFTHSEGRNRFNHELFNQNRSIRELEEEAKEYTKHAEKSLELVHKVWEEILAIK